MKKLIKMTFWDKVLISSIIVFNIGLILFNVFKLPNKENKFIEIKINNELVEKISINKNTEDIYNFEFGENTGYIEVKDGAVRMLEMDKKICPERICSDTGWISESYEIIVCLPNGIIMNIDENKENEVDIII